MPFNNHSFGCCFPGHCLMPGLHFKSECHTVDMLEPESFITKEQRLIEMIKRLLEDGQDYKLSEMVKRDALSLINEP